MKIGPVDIRNHTFSRKMRGIDEAEVRAYMDMVADRLEETLIENEDLRGQIDRLESQLSEFHRLEQTLRDSLVSAERVSGDRRAHAEREADLVIQNAHLEAEKVTANARQESRRLRNDIEDLRRQKVTYLERFRALLQSQSRILESSIENFEQDEDFADSVQAILEERPVRRGTESPSWPTPLRSGESGDAATHSIWDRRSSAPSAPASAPAPTVADAPAVAASRATPETPVAPAEPAVAASFDRRDSSNPSNPPEDRSETHRDADSPTPTDPESRWPESKTGDVPFAPWIASPSSSSAWRDRRTSRFPVGHDRGEDAAHGESGQGERITSYLGEDGLFSGSRGEPVSRMDED